MIAKKSYKKKKTKQKCNMKKIKIQKNGLKIQHFRLKCNFKLQV